MLALFEPQIPHDYVTINNAQPSFPAVYKGYTNVPKKHAAVHAYCRTWMVYRDAFGTELTNVPTDVEDPVDLFTLPYAPARGSMMIPMQNLLKERLPLESSS